MFSYTVTRWLRLLWVVVSWVGLLNFNQLICSLLSRIIPLVGTIKRSRIGCPPRRSSLRSSGESKNKPPGSLIIKNFSLGWWYSLIPFVLISIVWPSESIVVDLIVLVISRDPPILMRIAVPCVMFLLIFFMVFFFNIFVFH